MPPTRPTKRIDLGRMLGDADRALAYSPGAGVNAATLYLAVIAHILASQAGIPGAVPDQPGSTPTPPRLDRVIADLERRLAREEATS